MTASHATALIFRTRKHPIRPTQYLNASDLTANPVTHQLTSTPSLEQRLHQAYSNLFFHIFDATTPHWRMRQDYPHHLLFCTQVDYTTLSAWTPSGKNPPMISLPVQDKLNSIPNGSKVVIIHPLLLQRIELDPAYLDEILTRIFDWFTFDTARNDMVVCSTPGALAQAVVLGQDGQIANAFSTKPHSGRIVTSKKNFNFWEKRAELHRYYMGLRLEPPISKSAPTTDTERLSHLLGDTIDGLPIHEIFAVAPKAAIGIWCL